MSEEYENSWLYRLRHSAAHVMAQVVMEKFPEAKIAIGPAIQDGFYYDFNLPRPLSPDDLADIEAQMRVVVDQDHPFEHEKITKVQAHALFADQPYKLELIDDVVADGPVNGGKDAEKEENLSVFRHSHFVDLCRGPHVENTSEINPDALKLLSIAGVYWRGDEARPMLQRIYGTAWESAEQLDAYLRRREELKARDHRRLNKQLDLYVVHDDLGTGLVIYGPKAGRIRTVVEDFWRQEHLANGYELIYSPHIGLWKLWETSGHLDFFRDDMYAPLNADGVDYYLKPMNCPFHVLAYKAKSRSYRDLPMRWAELGTVYRYERSGVVQGLTRPRGFTQDDAHIICAPDQVEVELQTVLRFSLGMWSMFGFDDYEIHLSTRPDKAIGTEEQWDVATRVLRRILESEGVDYEVDEGAGAFYGPKIDLDVKDVMGRPQQLTTIQFDFNLPDRFDMVYIGQDGREHRPYMVHRALLGSWERFFAMLIEHYAGAFPVWLSPVQVQVVPIADRHNAYAYEVLGRLTDSGLRVEVDDSGSRMQSKIRDAQLQKIPYMAIVGDREVENGTIAVRLRTEENLGAVYLDEFVARAKGAVEAKIGLW